MEVSLKNALILEPFDRFQNFKRLNWLEFNFLLIGHTISMKLSMRQEIAKKKGLLELSLGFQFIMVVKSGSIS